MSRKEFTTLTSEGRDNLFRTSNAKSSAIQPTLSQKQNKFLQHFQTINNVDPVINLYNRSTIYTENNQALYMSKLQSYAQSKISQIERIIRSNQDDGSIKSAKNDYQLAKITPTIHVKAQIKRNVIKVNDFFCSQEQRLGESQKKEQQQILQSEILQIGVYSQAISILPLSKKQEPKPAYNQFYSIYNTPTDRAGHDFNSGQSVGQKRSLNFNTNNSAQTQRVVSSNSPMQNQFNSISLSHPPMQAQVKIRKADMLLVQILRQKKRKGLVSDYYKIMQLKLFQFLDFIVQDEPQFQGLTSIDKMKEVLKKLDSFKGKKVEGENKINLLKIFFEQFRNLKNQIAESQKKKPLQKVQNKSKYDYNQTKQEYNKSKQEFNKPIQQQRQIKNAQNKTTVQKWNKKPNKQTMSVGGDKRQKGQNPPNRSVKGVQDQWLGQLQ